VRTERNNLLAQWRRQVVTSNSPTTLDREYLVKIRKTYSPDHRWLKPALWELWHHLATSLQNLPVQAKNGDLFIQAISAEMNALEGIGLIVSDKSTGGTLPGLIKEARQGLPIKPILPEGALQRHRDSFVVTVIMITGWFLSLQDTVRAERWLRAGWWIENRSLGVGRDFFDERYKKIFEETGISWFTAGVEN